MSQAGSIGSSGGSGGSGVQTLTGDVGGAVSPDGSDNINIVGGGSITVTGDPGTNTLTISSPDYHVSRYIVSAGGEADGANYTTIATAYAAALAAGAPQTVFVQPGTYTENLTLSPGINIAAFRGDGDTPNVTIVGKLTSTITGTVSISNIRLQTNGDYVLQSTGANAGVINLMGCYINATNANSINNANANCTINLYQCRGNCSTNTYFIASAGAIKCFYCILEGNNTTTNSTFANADLTLSYTYFACPITTSGTGSVGLVKAEIITTNTTSLTHGGSGTSLAMETRFESGTASAISIGSTLPVIHSSVFSTNANAITGAGTLLYGMIVFYGTAASSTVNTSTQTALATLI
jgi:hypothetical protein